MEGWGGQALSHPRAPLPAGKLTGRKVEGQIPPAQERRQQSPWGPAQIMTRFQRQIFCLGMYIIMKTRIYRDVKQGWREGREGREGGRGWREEREGGREGRREGGG